MRFAALGDSLTAGVGDPVGDGLRGWAALLAGGLVADDADNADDAAADDAEGSGEAAGGAVRFRNFAVAGARARDVAAFQLPRALAYRPDVVSVVVGMNDTLRRTFDITEVALALDRTCAALSARGAVLLTACLPDPGAVLGLPGPLARPLARRQRQVDAVVHTLSARYGAVHLHLADAAWVADRTLWSADRLHPGERGHRTIAARFHALLAERGLAHGAAPGREPRQPPPSRADALRWLATAGTGWVLRRCHDLLPDLLRLAGAEVRHRARGTGTLLDLRAERSLAAALAAVSGPASVSGPAQFAGPAPASGPPAVLAGPAGVGSPAASARPVPVPVPTAVPLATMGE
ncbi:SGNH/GDSL hydrolase family protein [Streptomyces lavendulocolor]|uniref:SGNH/GDSL hydrolase family protein n=1 Tax=Streptomyces lavendulocolor TaxID=67316 RepID=UPI0033D6D1BE